MWKAKRNTNNRPVHPKLARFIGNLVAEYLKPNAIGVSPRWIRSWFFSDRVTLLTPLKRAHQGFTAFGIKHCFKPKNRGSESFPVLVSRTTVELRLEV